MNIKVNGKMHVFKGDPNHKLLWYLRDDLKLTGTKYACGKGVCGSCTVHVNGKPVRSCQMNVEAAKGAEVTTIEGLSKSQSHPLQKAWLKEQVAQCGYCQPGQIMQAAALLNENKNPNRDQIVSHMNQNLCRCGTYGRIIKAIQTAAKEV